MKALCLYGRFTAVFPISPLWVTLTCGLFQESKDLEFSAQKEIGVIEQLISKFEDAHLNYANMETD